MSSFNKVILVGNLTRDPELRFNQKGGAIANISIATNRKWKSESGEEKSEVTYVDITIFGKTAENVAQYMRKGSSMLVEGRLKLDTWDDKQTNQKRSKLGVVAESVQFLGSRPDTQQSDPPSAAPAGRQPTAREMAQKSVQDDESCPF